MYADAAGRARQLIDSDFFREWVSAGRVAATRVLDEAESAGLIGKLGADVRADPRRPTLVLEQERIPFVSYPHEWPAEMLYAAAELTVELQLAALEQGLMLKDATPSNVLFRGAKPVFVDVLSFVPRPTGAAIWPAYAQFVRTFVLPLLLHRRHGTGTHEAFLVHRDGLEPENVYARLSWLQRLSPTALKCASIPSWLGHSRAAQESAPATVKPMPDERAAALAPMLVRGLRRTLRSVRPKSRESTWSQYMATNTYDAEALRAKETFVRDALAQWQPRTVLDVGCNTGHFSRIASETGASVVAMDYDAEVVGRVFIEAQRAEASILPVVQNLARPSPGQGWRYRETSSFLDRAQGGFDVVLLLAVVHHLTVTDGIPLAEVFRLVAQVATKGAVIEYVPPTDPQFRRIVRNKEHLIPLLGPADFEAALAPWFCIARKLPVPGSDRVLHLLRTERDATA